MSAEPVAGPPGPASKYLKKAADITPRNPRWLDTPMGKGWVTKTGLTVLAGMQGLGKSTLAIGVAAHVSRKQPVIIFASEDDQETTLRPRLEAAGADLDRVWLYEPMRDFALPSSQTLLHELVTETKAKLVVFDPIIAYVDAEKNSWKDQDVRAVQKVLGGIAMNRKFAALGVMHPPKGDHREPLHALVGGSIAWTAGPRSTLALAKVDGETVLLHAKCNVGPLQPSRIVTLRQVKAGNVKTTVATVGGEAEVGLGDLRPNGSRPTPALDRAKGFLLVNVPPPPGIRTTELKEVADAQGLSWQTVKNAKMELPEVQAVRDEDEPRKWRWQLVPTPPI